MGEFDEFRCLTVKLVDCESFFDITCQAAEIAQKQPNASASRRRLTQRLCFVGSELCRTKHIHVCKTFL